MHWSLVLFLYPANLILIPIQPSPTDLWATKATIDLAEREHIPYHIIMNRVTPNSKLAIDIQNKLNNPHKSLSLYRFWGLLMKFDSKNSLYFTLSDELTREQGVRSSACGTPQLPRRIRQWQ